MATDEQISRYIDDMVEQVARCKPAKGFEPPAAVFDRPRMTAQLLWLRRQWELHSKAHQHDSQK